MSESVNENGVRFSGVLRRTAYLTLSVVYYLYRFALSGVMILPLALVLVVCGMLLDPAIPGSAKSDLMPLVINGFNQIFYYTVIVSFSLAFAVLLLEPFKAARSWLGRDTRDEELAHSEAE